MQKKLLFVYNAHAGKGQIKNKISDIVDIFVKKDYEVTIYPTQYYLDGYRKIRGVGEKYDLIVCSGGDGTLNETVSGIMNLKSKIPIGYIPAGTTNDFSTSLGIPKQPLKAAEVAVGDHIFSSDIGTLNGKYFVYVAAFGLFTDVSYQTNQDLKNVLGHSAYLLEGVKRLYNITSYAIKVRCEGVELSGDYLYGMVTNSISVGGFKNLTGKDVKLDDGLYEVTLIKRPQNPLQVNELIGSVLSGDLKNSSNIDNFKTSRLTITSEEEIPWTVDGEYGGDYKNVEIVNYQSAVQIHIP